MFKFWKKNEDENESTKLEEEVIEEIASDDIQEENQQMEENLEESIEQVELAADINENTGEEATAEEPDHDVVDYGQGDDIDSNEFQEPDDTRSSDQEDTLDEEGQEKKGIFSRLLAGLSKTKDNITGRIDRLLKSYTKIDEDLLEELEEILITADVGVTTTMEIIDRLRDMIKERGVKDPLEVRDLLKEIVASILTEGNSEIDVDPGPAVIVMVGVNGVGKTTTIGKLAQRYKKDGKKVMLAAADTFRAAATEQLDIWAKRVDVDIIKHHEGADPGAVVFDAIKASQARKVDLLICDTAGRLHNKANLMNELGKIFKIIDREYPEAKKEVLLVVDATTGQNAVSQAKTFKEVANITGIVLTKLDGTAKGGVVLAVKSEVDVPVKLIGVGERAEDLQAFDAEAFTDAIFG